MKLFFVAGEPTAWEFDELAHAGAEHLDSAYVAAYDEKSPTDWTEEVAELLRLGVGATRVSLGPDRGSLEIETTGAAGSMSMQICHAGSSAPLSLGSTASTSRRS